MSAATKNTDDTLNDEDVNLEFKIFREDIVVCPRDSSLLGVVEV